MRELLIIRHAVAFERNARRWPNDDDRPLTPDGIKKFVKAARALKELVAPPDELLTSSLIRAQQTAAILKKHARFPKPIEIEELKPDATPDELIAALRRRRRRRLAIVGHEPSLSRVSAALLKGSCSSSALVMKKGGFVVLQFERRIAKAAGNVFAFVPPRFLRAMR